MNRHIWELDEALAFIEAIELYEDNREVWHFLAEENSAGSLYRELSRERSKKKEREHRPL